MPPQYVKPYVKRQKNDAADAEAICEAVIRPTMRFVTAKTEEQQAVLMLHRTRRRPAKVAAVAMANKTARIIWAVLTQEREFRPINPAVVA